MAQNTSPIFPLTPQVAWAVALLTANTAKDGTGTVSTLFTAGANGGRCDYLKGRAVGTNTQSVLRVYINNGSTNATAANNALFQEVTLPATTLSETQEQPDVLVPLNLPLPTGYKVNVCIGTTVAAGWVFTAVGGDY